MADWGLLDGRSVMVRRMRAFAVASEMDRGGGSCFRQFVSGLVAWCALMTWNPDEDGGAFPTVCTAVVASDPHSIWGLTP